jgi:HEAT repeat protein
MGLADPRGAAAAAAALGALGDARAESSLLKSIGSKAHELQLAAARALGRLGTVRSVEPLLTLLDSRRLDAMGRQSVRHAVASIQSRLVGAGAGQISLAQSAAESGRLSLAKPRSGPGDLSRAPED